jgi:hypothetical protein
MTGPTPGAARARLVQPKVALPIIAVVMILVALLTPEQTSGRSGDSRLSSRLTSPQGAALLSELAARLGWQPSERLADSIPSGDTAAVHLVLDPELPLTASEARELLDRVRRGAGLVYVLGGGPLADSLRVRAGLGSAGRLVAGDTSDCDERGENVLTDGLPFWPDGRTYILAVQWRGTPPPAVTTLASVENDLGVRTTVSPAAVGFPLGRGRVAVVADPDLFRNDVLRVCRWGADVAAVRILEYVSEDAPGGRRRDRLVFDEYHQGFGDQPGTLRGIFRFLARTGSGHLVLQLAGAGLVLLLAVGPRLLLPRSTDRIERRSPLEHVDALARAYRAVGASRTATARLLHGVRRRVEHALGRQDASSGDEAFLAWAANRAPARAADLELIRRALAQPVSRRDFEAVGAALNRLEAVLTSFPRTS